MPTTGESAAVGTRMAGRLLEPVRIGPLALGNRLALAPMTRVSAGVDGRPTRQMEDYYAGFAEGGFGLLISEGLYTDTAFAQGYLHQPGLADGAQRDAWRSVVDRVHARGARIFAQLMHAGALSQGNAHRTGTAGPTGERPKGRQLAFYRGEGAYPVPTAMTEPDIRAAVAGFAESARRAREAGFDGVEVHGANGYLLDQFFTEGVNLRDDRYGGDLAGRLRLILETVRSVRGAVGEDFVVGLRMSQGKVNDFAHKWRGGEAEAATVFDILGRLPIDYIHTTEPEAWAPAFGTGPSLAALAKRHGGKTVIANGSLHDPARAVRLVEEGAADVVSLGRGALANRDWARRLAAGVALDAFDSGMLSPIADLSNAERHRAQGQATAG